MVSPPVFIIRAATPADAPAILQVHRESILTLGLETYSLAEVESWAAGLVPERYVEAMNEGAKRSSWRSPPSAWSASVPSRTTS